MPARRARVASSPSEGEGYVSQLETLDWLIIGAYLVVVFFVAYRVTQRESTRESSSFVVDRRFE